MVFRTEKLEAFHGIVITEVRVACRRGVNLGKVDIYAALLANRTLPARPRVAATKCGLIRHKKFSQAMRQHPRRPRAANITPILPS